MNRGKLLVQMAIQKEGASSLDNKNMEPPASNKSSSIISGTTDNYKQPKVRSTFEFSNFRSRSVLSEFNLASSSDISTIIPPIDKIEIFEMEEESAKSKVLRYLRNLDSDILTENNTEEIATVENGNGLAICMPLSKCHNSGNVKSIKQKICSNNNPNATEQLICGEDNIPHLCISVKMKSEYDFSCSESSYVPSVPASTDSEISQVPQYISNKFQISEKEQVSTNDKVLHYVKPYDFDATTKNTNTNHSENSKEMEIDETGASLLTTCLPSSINNNNINLTEERTFNKDNIQDLSSTIKDHNRLNIKSKSARERPTICPICYSDVITHFSRHLFRHHQNHREVMLIQTLRPRSKERLAAVSALRKQGYFYLKSERNIITPVKTSKNPKIEYFICSYCLGHYSKQLLHKHVKRCNNKPKEDVNPGKNCLARSQTFMALVKNRNNEFLKSSRLQTEVFSIMRPDNVSYAAKTDPLICLYGEMLLSKHKRKQIVNVISNKIREMGRLCIVLKSLCVDIKGLFDALKPEMFRFLISATKTISGYDEITKNLKTPSLALHMGTNLKQVCDVAFKLVTERRNIPNIQWKDTDIKRREIKDLQKLIVGHWCSELSSLALKTLQERSWEKPLILPSTTDIQLFHSYICNLAEDTYNNLNNKVNVQVNYRKLTECVLAQTVMFNRKRIGDVQYLKIETFNKDFNTTNQENFINSLTKVEQILCSKFKRVVTGGKGSKPVAILFSKRIQKYIYCLLNVRKEFNIVPKSNQYLFANPGSKNRWMAGVNVLRKLAKNSGVQNPTLLTSTKFRKHIATTLQLMCMEEDEIEQIASFMGHTKKTHMEFYRLPQDIYQTAKVAKVLMLIEKGKGNEFRGKSLNDIKLENDIYYSSESEHSEEDENQLQSPFERVLNRASKLTDPASNPQSYCDENNKHTSDVKEDEPVEKKNVSKMNGKELGRLRWSAAEKKLVLKYFQNHIKKKITPKKHECDNLIAISGNNLAGKDWIRIKTFVYNTFRKK